MRDIHELLEELNQCGVDIHKAFVRCSVEGCYHGKFVHAPRKMKVHDNNEAFVTSLEASGWCPERILCHEHKEKSDLTAAREDAEELRFQY